MPLEKLFLDEDSAGGDVGRGVSVLRADKKAILKKEAQQWGRGGRRTPATSVSYRTRRIN